MEKKKEQRKSLRRESKRKTRLENELIMEEMGNLNTKFRLV